MVTRAVFERTQSMHANGASADEIARALGISRSTVYKINQGRYHPTTKARRCDTCGGRFKKDVCDLCQARRRRNGTQFATTSVAANVTPQEKRKLETALVDILSIRVANYLDSAGVRTVHDVLMRTCRELLAVPGIGLGSFKQILRALDDLEFDTQRAWQFYNRTLAKKAGRKINLKNSAVSRSASMAAA
ncbi:MAG: helix-turn-helix domain-containing protein [Pirellulales bacterium]|nr:helix-turn-helix domain-containing protein [Pirellulales bacterium]